MLHFTYPGPAQNVSYHNHSNMSDGGNSLEEMCRAGKQAGLREMGMSDHWVVHPESALNPVDWSIPSGKLNEYVESLLKLKAELDDENFTLRLGLEVDFFFENYQQVLKDLKQYPFDYLIGSVHYSGTFPIDGSKEPWLPLFEAERDEITNIYWKKLEGATACGEFTFLGHLDLPKKFCMIDNSKFLSQALRVLDAAQKSDTAIELNTSGWFKDCKEQYPCSAILREAKQRRIPIVVNADAHAASHVQRSFSEAAALLASIPEDTSQLQGARAE